MKIQVLPTTCSAAVSLLLLIIMMIIRKLENPKCQIPCMENPRDRSIVGPVHPGTIPEQLK